MSSYSFPLAARHTSPVDTNPRIPRRAFKRLATAFLAFALLARVSASDAAQAALPPASVSIEQYYTDHYPGIFKDFGNKSDTKVTLASPVGVADAMNRGVNGKQWVGRSEGYTFKLTIENGSTATVDQLVKHVERFPKPYLRALQEVSDSTGENPNQPEDGIAVYRDLDGALGHGGKFYLNVHEGVTFNNGALYTTAHEIGHVLEQKYSETHRTMALWEAAKKADGRSVSKYGDGAVWEELADFAMFYAAALDHDLYAPDQTMLPELKSLSPQRFALWEAILGYDSATQVPKTRNLVRPAAGERLPDPSSSPSTAPANQPSTTLKPASP